MKARVLNVQAASVWMAAKAQLRPSETPGNRGPPGGKGRAGGSELDLLGDAKGIVDLDAQITDSAFELPVP